MTGNSGFLSFFSRTSQRILVTAGLVLLDPFGLGGVTERASVDIFAKLASPWYPTTERDKIVVILIDEKNLPLAINDCEPLKECNSETWPITFSEHAALLDAIVGDDPAGRPAAVFVDILFNNPHLNDPTFGKLAAVAARGGSNRSGDYPPIYFATEARQIIDPSLPRAAPAEGVPSLLEAVDGALTAQVSWIGKGYPVAVEAEGALRKSAAAALYEFKRQRALDEHAPAIFTVWGYNAIKASSYQWADRNGVLRESRCPEARSPLSRFGAMANVTLSGFFSNALPGAQSRWRMLQPCSFHAEIPAAELLPAGFESEFRFRETLKGSIVIVAAKITGIPDNVTSPVHGALPGAYFHAMTLDNLLVLGDDYFRASPNSSMTKANWSHSDVFEIAILAIGIIAAAALSSMKHVGWRAKALSIFAVSVVAIGLLAANIVVARSPAINWLGALTLAIGNILQATPKSATHNR